MNKEEFILELSKNNIILSDYQLDQLDKYYNLLVVENKKYNLTSITNEDQVYLKHFFDSLTLAKIIKLDNQKICDIGTGAGFPGIVLKIAYPNLQLTLVDATLKKCNFLQMVVDELKLDEVNIVNQRIEDFSSETREEYDIVTCRAVSNLKVLLEIAIPLVKINGYFIPMKGNISQEIFNIDNYYLKLNIELEKKEEFLLPKENSQRTLLKFKKINKTSNLYPRKYNEILKKEL